MSKEIFQFPVKLLVALNKSEDEKVYFAKLGKRTSDTVEILTGEQGCIAITVPCNKKVKLPSTGTILRLLPNGQLDPDAVYTNVLAEYAAVDSKKRTPVIQTIEC